MILVENEIVIAVMKTFEERPNGRLINGAIYPMGEVVEIDTPPEIIPQRYCYNETKGFYLNPTYIEPEPIVYPEPEPTDIDKLKEKLNDVELQSSILDLKVALLMEEVNL